MMSSTGPRMSLYPCGHHTIARNARKPRRPLLVLLGVLARLFACLPCPCGRRSTAGAESFRRKQEDDLLHLAVFDRDVLRHAAPLLMPGLDLVISVWQLADVRRYVFLLLVVIAG